jgi:hypothetical protein
VMPAASQSLWSHTSHISQTCHEWCGKMVASLWCLEVAAVAV